jgi:prepilin-type processing-associated H-X9-DG protein
MCPYRTPSTLSGSRRALTLVEVLLLAGVCVVVAGLLLPGISRMREASSRVACQKNLRQIAVAAFQFHDALARFPAGETVLNVTFLGPWNDEYYPSWVMPLLPYLGERERAAGLAKYPEFDDRHQGGKQSLYGAPMPVLVCRSDALPESGAYEYHSPDPASPTYNPIFPEGRYDAVTSYGANWGTQVFLNSPQQVIDKNGMFHYNTRTRTEDVLDGLSTTVLFGERSHAEPRWKYMGYTYPSQQSFAVFARWYTGGVCTGRQPLEGINFKLPAWVETRPPTPGSLEWRDLYSKRLGTYGSEHPGGCNFVMSDGSVHFVSEGISLTTLQALSTKSGGEVVMAH